MKKLIRRLLNLEEYITTNIHLVGKRVYKILRLKDLYGCYRVIRKFLIIFLLIFISLGLTWQSFLGHIFWAMWEGPIMDLSFIFWTLIFKFFSLILVVVLIITYIYSK